MEEGTEPNHPLEACLRLLKGEKDEEKIAGLLLASKHLKPVWVCFITCMMANTYRALGVRETKNQTMLVNYSLSNVHR